MLELDTGHPLATADDIGDDLALLAACNHTILSYGTFGQWAALLAGGRTVISSTAGLTKEGRELREAGLGPSTGDTQGWVWLEAGEGETGARAGPGAGGTSAGSHAWCALCCIHCCADLGQPRRKVFLL